MTVEPVDIIKAFTKGNGLCAGLRKNILVRWRWPGETAGGFRVALIFLLTFFIKKKSKKKFGIASLRR